MKKTFPYLKNHITISLADLQAWLAEHEIEEAHFERALQIYMAEKIKPVVTHLKTYKNELLDYPSVEKISWDEVLKLSQSLVAKVSAVPSEHQEDTDKILYVFSNVNEGHLEQEFITLLENEEFAKLAKSCDIKYRFLAKGHVALTITLFPE